MSWFKQAITLTQDLCSRASVTPEDKGCQQLIANKLDKIGFHCQHLKYNKVSNLFATHSNNDNNSMHLLIIGHTDVVPIGDTAHWRFPAFTPIISDGKLYARGVADMKGAVACFITAIEQFIRTHKTHIGTLSVLLTSDEEGPAVDGIQRVVRDYFKPNNIRFDYCLVAEPTSKKTAGDTIKIGRRGSIGADLTIIGKQGHVAYPEKAINPIHIALPFLQQLTTEIWDKGDKDFPATTLQCSNIQAGTAATNVIPNTLNLQFNLRYCASQTKAKLKKRIEVMLKQHQLNYQIDWNDSANPYISEANNHFVRICQQACQTIFQTTPKLSTAGGTSDGRFIAPMGTQVIELGPTSETIHQVNEHLAIDELKKFPQLYLYILENLLTTQP